MLKLIGIKKDYVVGNQNIPALKGIDLEFRENEFVSILGPSGCGKTTLLNIIGGLDKYSAGDLLIEGKSTKQFKDADWDAYRNNVIGMVFQNYNLIQHLSILDNVSLALTLSGISVKERKAKATAVLIDVGLKEHINKRPNQLSGGQMQRVAIARALVNDPKIILADEPTGALDTKTSVQIMDLLKKVSKDRLVIMVTHNETIAENYSDRIIKLLDGEMTSDDRPYKRKENETQNSKLINKKTSMSYFTAIKHSFKNLLTKKKRTIITSIAGSIGILGIALVLALSNGMTIYVDNMQRDALAGFPLTISKEAPSINMEDFGNTNNKEKFPNGDIIYSYDSSQNIKYHKNNFSTNFIDYMNELDKNLYNSLSYTYGIELNVITKTDNNSYKKITTSSVQSFFGGSNGYFNELPDNKEFVESQYDMLSGVYPTDKNQVVLIIDSYNRIDVRILEDFGINIAENYMFDDMIGRKFKMVDNNQYYIESNGIYKVNDKYEELYQDAESLEIVGIMRVKESANSQLLSTGICYTRDLKTYALEKAYNSNVVKAQIKAGESVNVLTGFPFNKAVTYESVMLLIGADVTPVGIQIYPKNFDSKDQIKDYIQSYNNLQEEKNKIVYTDLAESMTDMTGTLINTITIILVAFAGISLLVSSIMIGIITYVSVVERTKEIGVMRAIGARKKDVSRLFNAETLIIGFTAGIIGVGLSLLICLPANSLIKSLSGVSSLMRLSPIAGIILILLSMGLTLISGLIPSKIASKKDPVQALRTE